MNSASWVVGHLTLTDRRTLTNRFGVSDLPPVPEAAQRRLADALDLLAAKPGCCAAAARIAANTMAFFTTSPNPILPDHADDTHLASNCKKVASCSPFST